MGQSWRRSGWNHGAIGLERAARGATLPSGRSTSSRVCGGSLVSSIATMRLPSSIAKLLSPTSSLNSNAPVSASSWLDRWWRALARAVTLTTFLSGCGSVIVVSGIEVYESAWQEAVEGVAPQASFNLQCDASQIAYSLLRKVRRIPTEVGVEGCGRRAIYIREPYRSAPWVLNSAVQPK